MSTNLHEKNPSQGLALGALQSSSQDLDFPAANACYGYGIWPWRSVGHVGVYYIGGSIGIIFPYSLLSTSKVGSLPFAVQQKAKFTNCTQTCCKP